MRSFGRRLGACSGSIRAADLALLVSRTSQALIERGFMPYDSSLDKQLFTKAWEGEGTKISVSIYSYNNGIKKLQISRENFGAEGEPRFSKLGRLTKDEAQGILPLIQEALAQM